MTVLTMQPVARTRLRIAGLDVLRGLAILAMIVYHFAFDLELFGLADLGATEHWAWIAFVRTIPASFLIIAGISLTLAAEGGLNWPGYWWRIFYLGAAATLITVVSYFADPDAIIWFGIIHCIAVSSVIGLVFLRLPPLVTLLAAAAILVGPLFATPALNAPALLWLGLGTEAPPSNDYNPLFPWLGFMLIGIAVARLVAPYAANGPWAQWRPHDKAGQMLALAGRHSLLIYLVHQPILIGALFALSWMLGR
jgi:uncharacterized membrane protein